MLTFSTLNDLNNYVPNCVICSKPMHISITGIATGPANKPRWGSGSESIRVKFELKEGILRSKNEKHKMSIEMATNAIIEGADLISRLLSANVTKGCPTCHFKINTGWGHHTEKKENCFPALTIESEELHYTLKGGKDIQISKYYRASDPERSQTATIRLNNKYLPPIPFDFNKFSDLEHLNKRLDTIILFH